MPKYLVHAQETRTIYRAKYFVADCEEDAQELAELEDWRTWPKDGDMEDKVDAFIDFIEEV
jgi:hypothetical protein